MIEGGLNADECAKRGRGATVRAAKQSVDLSNRWPSFVETAIRFRYLVGIANVRVDAEVLCVKVCSLWVSEF